MVCVCVINKREEEKPTKSHGPAVRSGALLGAQAGHGLTLLPWIPHVHTAILAGGGDLRGTLVGGGAASAPVNRIHQPLVRLRCVNGNAGVLQVPAKKRRKKESERVGKARRERNQIQIQRERERERVRARVFQRDPHPESQGGAHAHTL